MRTAPSPTPTELPKPDVSLKRAAMEFRALLAVIPQQITLDAQLAWLEHLTFWLKGGSFVQTALQLTSFKTRNIRLRLSVFLLRENPTEALALAKLLRDVLGECSGLHLFGSSGLATEHGFFTEVGERIIKRILPRPPVDRDLADLVVRMFPSEDDAEWLEGLAEEWTDAIFNAITFGAENPEKVFLNLYLTMADSISLLSTTVSALGISEDVRFRTPQFELAKSPFLILNRRCERLTYLFRECQDPTVLTLERDGCFEEINECRLTLQKVFEFIDRTGVSLNLVYRLEQISHHLNRIETLIGFLVPGINKNHVPAIRFLADLIRARVQEQSVTFLLSANIHLLAKKIVESTGATGKTYITRTKAEYVHMVQSAAGGGVLTVFTVVIKFLGSSAHLPLFFEGLLASLNYCTSFVVMHLLGFKLATKQPSMTASALAAALPKTSQIRELAHFSAQVARITRSQFAAVLGNIGAVIPATLVFHFAYKYIRGKNFLSPETAGYLVDSLHPLQSLTVFYAALTGVLLWVSSLSSGWFENWIVYRRIPEAIAKHRRLRKALGFKQTEGLSRSLSKNVSGLAGSVTLGLLLGMIPTLGKFLGLPLDVRHVTLSTGALTLAAASFGPAFLKTPAFLAAFCGILIIGALNFGVSFCLALSVALRANETKTVRVATLLYAVRKRFFMAPHEFFYPPKNLNTPTPPTPKEISKP